MNMFHKRRILGVALAAALALGGAACGEDENEDEGIVGEDDGGIVEGEEDEGLLEGEEEEGVLEEGE